MSGINIEERGKSLKKKVQTDIREDIARGYYEFKEFKRRGVIAAFSGRRFKTNFCPDCENSLTVASRRLFCRLAGLSFDKLVCLEQVHGANIVRVEKADAGKGSRDPATQFGGTDAAITNVPEIVLSVRTADCSPVFFYDPVKKAIGIAHVGWRGAVARLTSKMIQAFRMQFLSKVEDLIVAIGPTIHSCCYQVGPEFQSPFGSFVTKRKKHFYFDLPGWIRQELTVGGITEASILDSHLCTACLNKRFPSYRKEGSKVRPMMSIISLREPED